MLIDRTEIKVHQSPVDVMIREIGQRYSLIVFPEGGRGDGQEIGEFKSGLYYLSKKRPDLELIPVYIDNMNRILPRGQFLPVPLLSCITFGPPMWLEAGESKDEFLGRGPRRRAAAEGTVEVLEGRISSRCRRTMLTPDPNEPMPADNLGLVGGVLILLARRRSVVRALRARNDSGLNTAILETFRLRVHAWWVLCSLLAAAFFFRPTATVVLFGLDLLLGLREFITLTPTRPGDHRTLFLVFFLLTPLQFVLVGMGNYALYSIVIPVYAFLFIPARIAMAGDYKRFLERTAKIEAGLLICVYCLSYAPALLTLQLPKAVGRQRPTSGCCSSSCSWCSSATPCNTPGPQIPSRHVIVPAINPTKTWEGLLGGTASVTLIGAVLVVGHALSSLVDGGRHVAGRLP